MNKRKFPDRKETSAYSLATRLKKYIRGMGSGVLAKRIGVSFVEVGPKKYKRIFCNDDWTPVALERRLAEVADSGFFPQVLIRYENELWVQYIEGDLVESQDKSLTPKLAEFYAYLYGKNSIEVSAERYVRELERDLQFLRDMSVLPEDLWVELSQLKEKVSPPAVWVGMDYTDAILKNFVIESTTGRLYAIDVESLQEDKLIGVGLAKAHMRWLVDSELEKIVMYMKEVDSPAFYEYFQFIELCFRAEWLKSIFLRKKWNKLDESVLRDLLWYWFLSK